MEQLDVYLCDSIERQVDALRKNIPVLSDLADREHPSPVHHDIIKGIFSRINQLAPSGEAVSR